MNFRRLIDKLRHRVAPDTTGALGLLYQAWTVIANGQQWLTDPDGEWVGAAKDWRDKYHDYLDSLKSGVAEEPL